MESSEREKSVYKLQEFTSMCVCSFVCPLGNMCGCLCMKESQGEDRRGERRVISHQ